MSRVFISRVFPLVCLAFCILGFFSFWRLTESPQTWMDEGAIDQVAMNMAQSGIYGYQIAPKQFISAEFLTTGYPVVYPVALALLIFGKSLFSARLVMALFIFLLGITAYWYVTLCSLRERSHYLLPVISLFLLVTFAPLYGHGKNVLGEVPGAAFFVLSLLLLTLFEQSSRTKTLSLAVGICAGLSMATKPLYLILALPSFLLVLFLFKRRDFSNKEKVLMLIGMSAPLILWGIIQSGGNSFFAVFSYGNPEKTSLLELVIANSKRFFLEAQPVYYLSLTLAWWAGLLVRKKRGSLIFTAEIVAFLFSVFNLLSFLITRGFYRYFFASEVLALLFLPYTLYYCLKLWFKSYHALFISVVMLISLVGLQTYGLIFHSWVSNSGQSTRAATLTQELGNLSPKKSVFFYHVPEAVLFLPHNNYYQYLQFADTVVRGKELLPLLQQGKPDFVLVDGRFSTSNLLDTMYIEKSHFDKYTLYEKK